MGLLASLKLVSDTQSQFRSGMDNAIGLTRKVRNPFASFAIAISRYVNEHIELLRGRMVLFTATQILLRTE